MRRLVATFMFASGLGNSAQAQIPPPPYAYVRGTDIGRDTVSESKVPVPKGKPDVLLRANFRNLGYYQGRPGWGIHIKYLILRTKAGPYHQWDTLANSARSLLQVEVDGRKVNRFDGSIAGFSPPNDGAVELVIADDGTVANRVMPLELEVATLDGVYKIDVALYNINDVKP
jgi:hypothetical protein